MVCVGAEGIGQLSISTIHGIYLHISGLISIT